MFDICNDQNHLAIRHCYQEVTKGAVVLPIFGLQMLNRWAKIVTTPRSHRLIPPRCSKLVVASAWLTIVENVAIATGPALLGAPRFFVLNLFFIICCQIAAISRCCLIVITSHWSVLYTALPRGVVLKKEVEERIFNRTSIHFIISIQWSYSLSLHRKGNHEKRVGTPFPRVPAPLHPWSLLFGTFKMSGQLSQI